jgi:hypothetical protein
MPTIILYFLLALVVLAGVMFAVPDERSAPTPSPRDVMLQLNR